MSPINDELPRIDELIPIVKVIAGERFVIQSTVDGLTDQELASLHLHVNVTNKDAKDCPFYEKVKGLFTGEGNTKMLPLTKDIFNDIVADRWDSENPVWLQTLSRLGVSTAFTIRTLSLGNPIVSSTGNTLHNRRR